jgi:hypothetical protein
MLFHERMSDRTSEPGKSLPFSPATKLAVLLAFSFLVCARLPNAVIQGRFWAEEGRVYFSAAAEQHWFSALTTVPQALFSIACAQIAYRSSPRLKAWMTVFLGYVVLIQVVNLPRGGEFDRGPNWSAEVSRFQSGETNVLRIWPPGWEFALCNRPVEGPTNGCRP